MSVFLGYPSTRNTDAHSPWSGFCVGAGGHTQGCNLHSMHFTGWVTSTPGPSVYIFEENADLCFLQCTEKTLCSHHVNKPSRWSISCSLSGYIPSPINSTSGMSLLIPYSAPLWNFPFSHPAVKLTALFSFYFLPLILILCSETVTSWVDSQNCGAVEKHAVAFHHPSSLAQKHFLPRYPIIWPNGNCPLLTR